MPACDFGKSLQSGGRQKSKTAHSIKPVKTKNEQDRHYKDKTLHNVGKDET